MGNKRLGIEAVRTVKCGQPQRDISGQRSVSDHQESSGQKEALQGLTGAYKINPNIFVRTLGNERETPPLKHVVFRQLIKFDGFEEETEVQGVGGRITGEILPSARPPSSTVKHGLKGVETLIKDIILENSEISNIPHKSAARRKTLTLMFFCLVVFHKF